MIVLREREPGVLMIDCGKEPGFNIGVDGLELRTALFVRGVEGRQILVEDGGQPGRVIEYVRTLLSDQGYSVRVEPTLERRFRTYEEELRLVEAVKKGRIKRVSVKSGGSFRVRRPLLAHQARAIQHALTVRHAANFSVPGSGKTTTALAVYAALREERVVDGLFVIGPASSFVPWEDEFQQTFGRPARSLRIVGKGPERAELLRDASGNDMVLCTYQMAYRERGNLALMLRKSRFLLVLDESHNIKNIDLGPWAGTAVGLAPLAERRMILTGTPAPHSLRDLWSQFTFLWPSEALVGSRVAFERRIEDARTGLANLKRELGPFFVRAKRSELGLPKPSTRFYRIPYRSVPKRQRLIVRLLELKTLTEARQLGLGKTDVATLRGCPLCQ